MDLSEIFRKKVQDKTTELGQMYEYLKGQNQVPTVSFNPAMDPNTGGAFQRQNNHIELNPNAGISAYGTLNHETNHAMIKAIREQLSQLPRGGYGRTNSENQLQDGHDKLLHKVSRLDFGIGDEDRSYREDPNEYTSFGVGNMSHQGAPTYPVAPHVDATGATEAAILRDLALRTQKDPNKDTNRLLLSLKQMFSF